MIEDELKIPSSWTWARFNEVADVASDLVDPTLTPQAIHIAPNHIESGTGRLLPYGTVAEDGVTSPKHRFNPGQILYSKIRPYLAKAVVATFDGVCSADMYPISTVLETRFLHHWLLTFWFTKAAAGHQGRSVLPKINREALGRLPVPVPPAPEQRRIVAAIEANLTRLDVAVANLERVRAKLKRYRATVLKAACEGRLVPTEAELARAEGRTYEPADRLLTRILKQRRERWEADQLGAMEAQGKRPANDKWKDRYREPASPPSSGLEELPEGWMWTTIDTLLTEPPCNGISIKGSDVPPGVPALRLNAMGNHGFDYSAVRYLPIGVDIARDLEIVHGDFFVSRGNGSRTLVGRGTLAQQPPFQVVFPDTMIRLRFDPSTRAAKWAATIWPSGLIRHQIEGMVKTTAGIWKIAQPQVMSIVVPLPPDAEQARIVAEVHRRLSLIDELDAAVSSNLKRADRLRQSILKRAFEGKLVPQDPNDEPAEALLERITKGERQAVLFDSSAEATMKGRRSRRGKRA